MIIFPDKKTHIYGFAGLVIAALLVSVFLFWRGLGRTTVLMRETARTKNSEISSMPLAMETAPLSFTLPQEQKDALDVDSVTPKRTVRLFSAAAVAGVNPVYHFSGYIPAAWQGEAVRQSEALNLYLASGKNERNLENAEILVSYFRANSFITAPSVKVISRQETKVGERPAVAYVIEKKVGYQNFSHQPLWRNTRHRVMDVRLTDEESAVFYRFAKRPDLPDAVFEAFLNTLDFNPKNLLFYPTDYFPAEITKKPFGLFVSPSSSPVYPEKFSGYHTGADVEIPETVAATATIPVFAVADGVVAASRRAKGYGGVVIVLHEYHGESFKAIYGHLNPTGMLPQGRRVKAGQIIGVLGRGFTKETDGERRHLHFGIYSGAEANIAGYVPRQEELTKWIDPEKWFAERMP